ncbi:MAG: hypothetical protein PHG85_03265 [Candidatus Altiarchaeota archaeon]|nr:hypothetical protein [Candidatus Altiarchaeota archaeon]
MESSGLQSDKDNPKYMTLRDRLNNLKYPLLFFLIFYMMLYWVIDISGTAARELRSSGSDPDNFAGIALILILSILMFLFLISLLGVYLGIRTYWKTHSLRDTFINGWLLGLVESLLIDAHLIVMAIIDFSNSQALSKDDISFIIYVIILISITIMLIETFSTIMGGLIGMLIIKLRQSIKSGDNIQK